MIFNYDPILGLQYESIQGNFVRLNVSAIPTMDTKEFIEKWREWQSRLGISLIIRGETVVEEIELPIFHNLNYLDN